MKTKGGIIEAAMKYRQIVILIVSLMFFLGIYALIKTVSYTHLTLPTNSLV